MKNLQIQILYVFIPQLTDKLSIKTCYLPAQSAEELIFEAAFIKQTLSHLENVYLFEYMYYTIRNV